VQVDAIEQRPAHAPQVPLNNRAGAAAFPRGVAVESARTPVQITTATLA
jgi:hypothetical protein